MRSTEVPASQYRDGGYQFGVVAVDLAELLLSKGTAAEALELSMKPCASPREESRQGRALALSHAGLGAALLGRRQEAEQPSIGSCTCAARLTRPCSNTR